MTQEIFRFMSDEARLAEQSTLSERVQGLEKLALHSLEQGFPAHGLGEATWTKAAELENKAQVALWAVLSSALYALNEKSSTPRLVELKQASDQFMNFIHRNRFAGGYLGVVGRFMSYLDFRPMFIFQASLEDCDIYGSDFSSVHFQHVRLLDVRAVGVGFQSTQQMWSDFTRADLAYSDFSGSYFNGARFVNANLEGVSFADCTFTDVYFSGSELVGADFSGADVKGVKPLDIQKKIREALKHAKPGEPVIPFDKSTATVGRTIGAYPQL